MNDIGGCKGIVITAISRIVFLVCLSIIIGAFIGFIWFIL